MPGLSPPPTSQSLCALSPSQAPSSLPCHQRPGLLRAQSPAPPLYEKCDSFFMALNSLRILMRAIFIFKPVLSSEIQMDKATASLGTPPDTPVVTAELSISERALGAPCSPELFPVPRAPGFSKWHLCSPGCSLPETQEHCGMPTSTAPFTRNPQRNPTHSPSKTHFVTSAHSY